MITLKLHKKEYSFDDIQKMNEDELADFLDIYAEHFYEKGYHEGYKTAELIVLRSEENISEYDIGGPDEGKYQKD